MKKIRVGIVGCGAIGSEVSSFILTHLNQKFRIVGLYDLDHQKRDTLAKKLKLTRITNNFERLLTSSELIIECASVECAEEIFQRTLNESKMFIILSSGVFIKRPDFIPKLIKRNIVYIPSGAICGIDGISSLKEAKIRKLRLITSKPPSSLAGVKFLEEKGVDVYNLKEEKVVFKGSIKKAVKYFPRNINVAATLYLASQFKNIEVIIKVNPKIDRNIHCIEVESDKANLNFRIENIPSIQNPKTSALAILSVKSLLLKIVTNIKVGS